MKRLLLLTILLVVTLIMLSTMLRAVGATTPTPQAATQVLGISDCAPPCWHHLMPGKTTIDEAIEIITQQPRFIGEYTVAEHNSRLCGALKIFPAWTMCATPGRGTDHTIKTITLRSFEASDVKLGDVIQLLGTPSAIWPCAVGKRARVGIYFDNDVEVWAFDDDVIGRPNIDPNLPVRQILLHYPGEDLPYAFDLARWQGFQTFPPEMTCPTMP